MSNTTIPIVVAGIIQKEKVLLLQREKEPFKDLWSLPGGKIESNEFITDALIREVSEETNLFLKSIKFCGIVSEKITNKQKNTYGHLINIFLIDSYKGKIKSSIEGKLKWFTLEEIKKQKSNIIPTDYAIITQMLFCNQIGLYNCIIECDDQTYSLKYMQKIE